MSDKCICDKCRKENECIEIEYACVYEGTEEVTENKKTRDINTLRYITSVTSRVCKKCLMKRKVRFILFALASALASLPFFITGEYLEFGFVFIVVAVTVGLLSTSSHEMEYVARLHYKKWREETNEFILHPKLFKKEAWEDILKNKDKGNFKIIS